MTKDCYGTCPKCGNIGWCHYKGKAHIFKSGPGTGTYKVSIFKCRNCGKKFGFQLEDGVMEPKDELDTTLEDLANDYEIEEATGYKEIRIFADILYDHIYDDPCNINIKFVRDTIKRIINIADKYCDEEEDDAEEEKDDWNKINALLFVKLYSAVI